MVEQQRRRRYYSLEQFGLTVPMFEEVFGDYLKRFGKFIEPRP